MRLVTTNLTFKEVQPKLKELVDTLFKIVPAGVGAKGFVKVNKAQFKDVMEQGSKWCVENDYGWKEDLERTEGYGRIDWADSSKVSDKATSRGINQMGTLGSGNHYLEIQKVEEHNIVDKNLAKKLGIFPNQIVVMVHCLPGESKVMTEYGAWIRIKDLEKNWNNINVKSLNLDSKKVENSNIIKFFKLDPHGKIFKIITKTQKEIIATEDHPLLTENGLKFIKEINTDEKIAISPFNGVEYEEPNNEVVVDEDDLKKIGASERTIRNLKKKELLPLRYNSKKLPVLVKLLGFLIGDGWLGKSSGRWTAKYIGNPEDLENIRKDIFSLGYKCNNISTINSSSKIIQRDGKERTISGNSNQFSVSSLGLPMLFYALGAPFGNKSKTKFNVPKWLFKAPLWIKRLYLASYFGAEMSKPATRKYEPYRFGNCKVSLNKIEQLKDNGYEFLDEIRLLLKEFGIECGKIVEQKAIVNKDMNNTVKLILQVSSEEKNIRRLWGKINYEYNLKRSILASHALQYLNYKNTLLEEESVLTSKPINQLQITSFKFRKIQCKTFEEFVLSNKLNPISEIIWDEIDKIEEIKNFDDYVYDFTVEHKDHTFISDNFVVGNCGSRGFGHQIATDYLQKFDDVMKKYNIVIRDRELSCAPFNCKEGQDYYKAMACAANMAFANRQVILHRIREGFSQVFKKTPEELEMNLVYDVAHNVAKIEEHKVDGKKKKLIVHRKGSTRAFPPGHEELNKLYKDIGQPVIIGGSMETGSYLLVGTKKAMDETFGTTCFTGETKIITDKGIIELSEIYNRFNIGEDFLVPSLNEENLEIEWRPILDTMKRDAEVIEVSISQRGKITQNRLKTTKDHKFITLEDGNIIHKEINEILKNKEGLILLDGLKPILESNTKDEKAYLIGAIMSDGYFRVNGTHGSVVFTQKKIDEKINFIEHVTNCFKETYGLELADKGTKVSSGFIRGKQVIGYANDFICYNKIPSQDLKNIYKNLDSWVLSLNKSATINFLAGMIDGDGTWNKKRQILEIFNGDKKIVGSIVLACLKLGILPYVSKQRKSCYIIQISEKEDLIFNYTKRVKGIVREKKYGAKLYLAKQLFSNIKEIKWPFLHKSLRNNLMSDKVIAEHIHKYPNYEKKIRKLINSPLRMQRTNYIGDLGKKEVYNISIEDNHNYFVLTDMFIPVLVKNCHGSGRTMSRTQARHEVRGDKLQKDMEDKGIYVRTVSMSGLAEEAGVAYKDIN